MAIQNRRGQSADFVASKMVPGEFAVSQDNRKLYLCFTAGNVKEIAIAEDMANAIAEMNLAMEEWHDEVVEDTEDKVEDAEAWAQGTRGGTPVSSTDPTYQHNAKYYAENIVDNTLSIAGKAADAKKTGDEISDLKDDLGETVRFDIVQAKTDAEKARARTNIKAASESDIFPSNAKSALIEVLKRAIYLDHAASGYLRTLISILIGNITFEWDASSGSLPAGMTYESAELVDNEYYDVENPLFESGFCDSCIIEVECAFDTSTSRIIDNSIMVADAPSHGNKLYFSQNGNITLASKTSDGTSNNLVVNDVDITEFHKYKMEFNGNTTKLYIDNEFVGERDSYNTVYVRMPVLYSNTTLDSKIKLKSIKYTLGDIVETDYYATIYKGVGLNSSATPVSFVANNTRCISGLIYFITGSIFTFSVYSEEEVFFAVKYIDSNGNIWANNVYEGYKYLPTEAPDYLPSDTELPGWLIADGKKLVTGKKPSDASGAFSPSVLPNTNGTVRFIFRKRDNSEFDEIPDVKITLYLGTERDVEYGVKEGDPNDIL